MRRARPTRGQYPFLTPIPTRWMDNDIYGHVNNVVFYSFFDTTIAHFLMREGGLDPWHDQVIGFAITSGCHFHSPVAFPTGVTGGLRVAHLGNSSVRYEVGIFADGEDEAAADGHFVHVFVDRVTQRPQPVPAQLRGALSRILVHSG